MGINLNMGRELLQEAKILMRSRLESWRVFFRLNVEVPVSLIFLPLIGISRVGDAGFYRFGRKTRHGFLGFIEIGRGLFVYW